jgi:hypothetical protein
MCTSLSLYHGVQVVYVQGALSLSRPYLLPCTQSTDNIEARSSHNCVTEKSSESNYYSESTFTRLQDRYTLGVMSIVFAPYT